jgi:hypothetical protein
VIKLQLMPSCLLLLISPAACVPLAMCLEVCDFIWPFAHSLAVEVVVKLLPQYLLVSSAIVDIVA